MKRGLWIFKKELRETFRDKRVRTGAFIMPIFMILMFVQIFGLIENSVKKENKVTMAVIGTELDRTAKRITDDNSKKVIFVKTREEGIKLLQTGKVGLVLDFGKGLEKPDQNGQASLEAIYDGTAPLSQISLGRLQASVQIINGQSLALVLQSAGIPPTIAQGIKFKATEAEKPKGLGDSPMVQMLPYLIVLWAFSGGISIVGDMVAGEKEKGTMETLLVSPVLRHEVLFGKFFALAVICLISSLTSLLGILIVGALKIGFANSLFPNGLNISFPSVVALMLALIPLVLLSAGILISVSAFAKNIREAQTYLTIVNFAVIMPAIFSQIIGFTGMQNALWVKFVPILGNSICIKEALVAKTDWVGLLANASVCIALAGVFFLISRAMFAKETILART